MGSKAVPNLAALASFNIAHIPQCKTNQTCISRLTLGRGLKKRNALSARELSFEVVFALARFGFLAGFVVRSWPGISTLRTFNRSLKISHL